MVILKDTRRFELTVDAHYGEWVAKLLEFVPGRLFPTQHLLRAFDTRQAAIDALAHKWRVLFPDDAPLVWHDPPPIPPRSRSEKPRRRS